MVNEYQQLFAWLGMTDLRASRGELDKGETGPIGQAAQANAYDEIWLLSDHPNATNIAYAAWLRPVAQGAKIHIQPHVLTRPTDHHSIAQAAMATVHQAQHVHPQAQRTYHLSPGTPAMASVWLLLGSTIHPAQLIESSRDHGVRPVTLPFGISADFPPLISGQHTDLITLARNLPNRPPEFDAILHRCEPMQRAVAQARAIAQHDVPVLLLGESGTGKELFAAAIHADSRRSRGPMIAVNCGAIPESLVEHEFFGSKKGSFTGSTADHQGHLEQATGGILFLDEIGELPAAAQVKLLRVLQEQAVVRVGESKPRKVDVRIIAATNRDLLNAVNQGNFRGDLFHRLAIGVIYLPPLRERQSDIGLLIDDCLDRLNVASTDIPGWKQKDLSASARNLMVQHPWPGNVRELMNTVHRAAIWAGGDTITEADIRSALFPVAHQNTETEILNRPLGSGFDLRKLLADIEQHYLKRAMHEAQGVKTKASELLGLGAYQNVANALKKYGMEDLAR